MGNWKLEVFKMGLYMAFPVSLFYFFNQPVFFEMVTDSARKQFYIPDNKEDIELYKTTVAEMNKKHDENIHEKFRKTQINK